MEPQLLLSFPFVVTNIFEEACAKKEGGVVVNISNINNIVENMRNPKEDLLLIIDI
jgi:hypothetical protein